MSCGTCHNACACREAEFAKLKEQLAEKDAEIWDLKRELICSNERCPADHEHHYVWCDHVIQQDLKEWRQKLAAKDAEIERLKAELSERIKRSDIWMRSDTQAREYANRLENQLAASEARERALTDALEDACDGLACAYDDLKHCNVEECLPLVSEVVSCKSYLDEARKALAASQEKSE